MKVFYLIILYFLFNGNSLFACLSASQNRLFPLGQIQQGLCVVEAKLNRSDQFEKGTEKLIAIWNGVIYLKIYNTQNQVVFEDVIDSFKQLPDAILHSTISKLFIKGLEKAKRFPGFIIAKTQSISFCHYQKQCNQAKIVFNKSQHKLNLVLNSNKTYDLKSFLLSHNMAANVKSWAQNFSDGASIDMSVFKDNLFINSIRKFTIGNRKLTIVHLCTGQALGKRDVDQNVNVSRFKSIEQSVVEEPVLHHGNGFDYFFWE